MEMNRFYCLVLGALALNCSANTKTSSQSEGPVSTVRGALAITSFPTTPTTVEAMDETGAKVQAGVDPQGRFRLALAKGHTYRFMVALASSSEPLVFPRASSRLDTTVRISTGAATIDLGTIRHLDAAPAGGFAVKSTGTTKPQTENADEGDDGECVDGKDATSGAVCVDDDTKTGCDLGDAQDNGADGECENGRDTSTGAACSDEGDDGETNDDHATADPTKPMAVPEHNAPDDVAGCNESKGDDGDGETNDD